MVDDAGTLIDMRTREMYDIVEEVCPVLNALYDENERLKSENQRVSEQKHIYKQDWKHLCIDKELLDSENEQLKSENKRLTDKLNKTALELVDGCISQGKATEISEMSYSEFLDYRAKNGKPMELQL